MAAHTSSTRLLRRFGAVLALATLSLAFSAAANAATPSTGLLKIGGPFPASVKAGDFRYVILHSDRAALIPALKAANPQLKVLVYKDMAAALSWAGNTQVPAGVSMAEAEANPEWFLRDTTGKRIEWCDFGGDWQMDVGSRSYQDRWAANVAADMRANGWDGVFVDDTNASQSWHLCGRTIAKYPTDAAYAAATRSFLANAGPALTSQGFLVIPNIYLPYSSSALATWVDWISFTSGGMQEFWSKWGTDEHRPLRRRRLDVPAAVPRRHPESRQDLPRPRLRAERRRALDALRPLDVPARLGRRPERGPVRGRERRRPDERRLDDRHRHPAGAPATPSAPPGAATTAAAPCSSILPPRPSG